MRWLLSAVAGALLLAGGAVAAYPWLEPARMFYAAHGIDVSHHQGTIDWPAVAASNVSFTYIKATEGGDFVDPRFAANWAQSHRAGIARGAYHFFTQCRTGGVQAANFMRTVPRAAAALPHAVDVEHMGPCKRGPTVADVVAEITVFLDRLEGHYGQRPIIYTTREFHDAFLVGRLSDESYWIRSLVVPPRFRRRSWVIWQYHNRGRRRGIVGPVDLNVAKRSWLSSRVGDTAPKK